MSTVTPNAPTTTSRTKTTKGLVAGVVGIALLTAGGGTFARWYDQAAIEGGTIASGALSLKVLEEATWTDKYGSPVNINEYVVVPGDVLTYTNNVSIDARGDDLHATLRTNLPELTKADSALGTALDVELAVNGVSNGGGEVVIDDDVIPGEYGEPMDVVATVTFPEFQPGAESASWGQGAQGQAVTLSQMQIVLEQHANPVSAEATQG